MNSNRRNVATVSAYLFVAIASSTPILREILEEHKRIAQLDGWSFVLPGLFILAATIFFSLPRLAAVVALFGSAWLWLGVIVMLTFSPSSSLPLTLGEITIVSLVFLSAPVSTFFGVFTFYATRRPRLANEPKSA
jgi:hypothetical protein